MSPELLYYALVALTTAASAYGSLRARIKIVERRLDSLTKSIETLHEKIDKRPTLLQPFLSTPFPGLPS